LNIALELRSRRRCIVFVNKHARLRTGVRGGAPAKTNTLNRRTCRRIVQCETFARGARLRGGQANHQRGASTERARDVHLATVALDDTARDEQAKAAADALGLGGEKGLEHALQGGGIYSRPAVRNPHRRALTGASDGDLKDTARAHRLTSVGDDVDENLGQV